MGTVYTANMVSPAVWEVQDLPTELCEVFQATVQEQDSTGTDKTITNLRIFNGHVKRR